MKDEMLKFRKLVYLMFRKYPLYLHKVDVPGEQARLSVLLAGSGKYMDTILDSVLTQGQLLDTELAVTLLCPDANEAKSAFIAKAPGWEQFLAVDEAADPESCGKNATEKYAEIHFVSYRDLADLKKKISENHSRYSYVIVSTDDPEESSSIAGECIEASRGIKRIIAYRCRTDNGTETFKVRQCSKDAAGFRAQADENNNVSKELERIAFNLHYSYAKQRNDHEPVSSIRKSYDEYSHISSLCAAEHLLSKLACCGIDTPDNKTAAKDFQEKISQDGQLFDRLTDLEHRRWVVEKVLQGYRMPDEKEIRTIFENGNTSRGQGENGKWHCCLVESRPDSRIKKEHWDMSQVELENSGLDGLDRMSVRIHQICGEKAGKKRMSVEKILIPRLKEETATGSADIKDLVSQLELSISQLFQTKRSVIAIYKGQLAGLKTALGNDERYRAALDLLGQIENALVSQIEFISYTDYKDSDRQFIGMMPYVLTHDSDTTIIKLVSDKSTENIFSTWKMEPRQVYYLAFADSDMELDRIRGQHEIVSPCVDGIIMEEKSIWKVFVPQRILDNYIDNGNNFRGGAGSIEAFGENYKNIYDSMAEIAADSEGPYYLDTTGADQKQARICGNIAKELGIGNFCVDHNNRFENLENCAELEYPMPDKSITVKEMFNWNGAVERPAHANVISDASTIYKKIWKIAKKAGPGVWNSFVNEEVSVAGNNLIISDNALHNADYMTVIKNLEDNEIINRCEGSNKKCVSRAVPPFFEKSGNALEEYIYYTALLDGDFSDVVTGWEYNHSASEDAASNELDVICIKGDTSLFISAKYKICSDSKIRNQKTLNGFVYEIANQAEMFGINAKSIIAHPTIPMFEGNNISSYVRNCSARGVYLLGDKCFEGDNLAKVLQKIADGENEWYQFMMK